MHDQRESPNPFEPPQTRSLQPSKKGSFESANPDYKHQTIGFVVLTLTCAVGLAVGFGAAYFADGQWLGLDWNWKESVFAVLSVILIFPSAPGLLVCACWTLLSASQWMVHANANRISTEDSKG